MRDRELTYRWLLLAYPRPYRQERGLEILTTLMDAAESGRRSPSARDALDIVLSGLRFRFSPARGWFHWAAVAVASAFIGMLLANIAGALAWKASPTMPHPGQAASLQPAALLHETVDRPAGMLDHNYLLKGTPPQQEGWTGGQPAPSYIEQVYRPETLDPAMLGLYERMPRDGWQVGELVEWESSGYVFWASRDGTIVRVRGLRLDGASPSITVHTHLAEPRLVTPVATAAFVLGAFAAWLMACGLSRRTQRKFAATRRSALVIALFAVGSQAILLLLTLGWVVMLVSHLGWAHYHWLAPPGVLGDGVGQVLTLTAFIGSVTLVATILTAPDQPAGFRREPISP